MTAEPTRVADEPAASGERASGADQRPGSAPAAATGVTAAPAVLAGGGPRLIAIVPCRDEETAIGEVVASIRAAVAGIDVVVIDDGSADRTAERARAAGARVVRHPVNLGYGCALQTGYKWALRRGYPFAVQIDGDGQHDARDIPRLLAPVLDGSVDACLGSRYLAHPEAERPYRAGLLRRAGMLLFGAVASVVTRQRFTDPTSGFQALSERVLRVYCDDRYPYDYPDADQLIVLRRAGFRIGEVPARMHASASGRSMHAGLRPIYYVITMLLAIFIAVIQEPIPPSERGRGGTS